MPATRLPVVSRGLTAAPDERDSLASYRLLGRLSAELGITRQTLYRHVDPNGLLRPDGEKLLG